MVISPHNESTIKIKQEAYISLVEITKNQSVDYNIYSNKNGVYIFVISGSVELLGENLKERDGIAIEEINNLKISGIKNSEILIMEIPMINCQ